MAARRFTRFLTLTLCLAASALTSCGAKKPTTLLMIACESQPGFPPEALSYLESRLNAAGIRVAGKAALSDGLYALPVTAIPANVDIQKLVEGVGVLEIAIPQEESSPESAVQESENDWVADYDNPEHVTRIAGGARRVMGVAGAKAEKDGLLINFDQESSTVMRRVSAERVGKELCLLFDGTLLSRARVMEAVSSGLKISADDKTGRMKATIAAILNSTAGRPAGQPSFQYQFVGATPIGD
jgi:hypothetical protein